MLSYLRQLVDLTEHTIYCRYTAACAEIQAGPDRAVPSVTTFCYPQPEIARDVASSPEMTSRGGVVAAWLRTLSVLATVAMSSRLSSVVDFVGWCHGVASRKIYLLTVGRLLPFFTGRKFTEVEIHRNQNLWRKCVKWEHRDNAR